MEDQGSDAGLHGESLFLTQKKWLPFIVIKAASILTFASFVGPVHWQLVNIDIDDRQETAAVTNGEWVRVIKWGSACMPHDAQNSKELKKLLLVLFFGWQVLYRPVHI